MPRQPVWSWDSGQFARLPLAVVYDSIIGARMIKGKSLAISAIMACIFMTWGHAQAQMAPVPTPIQPSCETKLAIWQENGHSFIQQVMSLEAQNRELRNQSAKQTQDIAKLTVERDVALAKVKAEEKQSKALEEK